MCVCACVCVCVHSTSIPFGASALLVGQQEGHPAGKKLGVGTRYVDYLSGARHHHLCHP